jgi:hypothetical protein
MAGDGPLSDKRSEKASPGEYEAFFDEVAEVTRFTRDHEPLENLDRLRGLMEKAVAALPLGAFSSESSVIGPDDMIASSSLSGGENPCSGVDCRVKSAAEGARFAALYAEQVWIRHPFESISHHDVDDYEYVTAATAAIATMLEWKPLLLAGIAAHLAPVCASCAAEQVASDKLLKTPIDDLGLDLIDELALSAEATVTRDEFGELVVEMRLPSKYTGHKVLVHGPSGESRKRLARFLGKRGSRKVPGKGPMVVHAFASVWRSAVDEAVVQAMYRGLSGASYVSNLPFDLELASKASADQPDVEHAERVVRALKHSVPIVEDVPLSTVLRLREEDKGSFHLYRKRVAALRSELGDEKRLREAGEQLRSEFVALETQIIARQKSLWGGVRDQVKIATGTVGAGIGAWLANILTPTVSGVIAAAGGLSLVHKLTSEALSVRRATPAELAHPLYFLWRIKKSPRRGL